MQQSSDARLDRRIDNLWAVTITLIGRIPKGELPAFWKEVEELVGFEK